MPVSVRERVTIHQEDAVGGTTAPTILIPVTPNTFRASETTEQILDRGRRGQFDAMDWKAFEGVTKSEISWEGIVERGDASNKPIIGYLLKNILADGVKGTTTSGVTETDSGSSRYDHRLVLGNTKTYLTVQHDLPGSTGSVHRAFYSCRVTELVLKYNAGEGTLTYSVTLQGKGATLVAERSSVVDATTTPWMGWNSVISVIAGAAATARVISAEWTLSRAPFLHYAGATDQNFADIYLGPLEVLCSMVVDLDATHTDLVALRAKTQAELSTTFRVGTVNTSDEEAIRIGGVTFDLGDSPAELDTGSDNVRLGITARGLSTSGTTVGPFSSEDSAASVQNGPVQIQMILLSSNAY